MNQTNETLTAIAGLRVGHAHDTEALTGCTVILCEAGAVGGVDQRGARRARARPIYCGLCTWWSRCTPSCWPAARRLDWTPPAG